MSKIAVIYRSKYGDTKQYAEWITLDLGADLFEMKDIKSQALDGYDTVLFGGGIYVGKINGFGFISRNFSALKSKKLAVFAVGLSDVKNKEELEYLLKTNFSEEMKNSITLFQLRSGLKLSQLKAFDRFVIKLLRQMLLKKSEDTQTEQDKETLKMIETGMDFTDRNTIAPIVNFARG